MNIQDNKQNSPSSSRKSQPDKSMNLLSQANTTKHLVDPVPITIKR